MPNKESNYQLSVVVPCFNEEENIPELVRRLQEVFKNNNIAGEIVFVDDGSKDATSQRAGEYKAQYPNINCIQHSRNQGIVAGWQTGARNAKSDYVVIIDADMQYAPEDIPALYFELMKGEHDIVQGWRQTYDDSNYRFILSAGFSKMLNLIFGLNLNDIKSGFLATGKQKFLHIFDHRYHYNFYQHLITISAVSKGYTIKQIPVKFNQRYKGKSFITSPITFSLKAVLELPKAFWEFRVLSRKH